MPTNATCSTTDCANSVAVSAACLADTQCLCADSSTVRAVYDCLADICTLLELAPARVSLLLKCQVVPEGSSFVSQSASITRSLPSSVSSTAFTRHATPSPAPSLRSSSPISSPPSSRLSSLGTPSPTPSSPATIPQTATSWISTSFPTSSIPAEHATTRTRLVFSGSSAHSSVQSPDIITSNPPASHRPTPAVTISLAVVLSLVGLLALVGALLALTRRRGARRRAARTGATRSAQASSPALEQSHQSAVLWLNGTNLAQHGSRPTSEVFHDARRDTMLDGYSVRDLAVGTRQTTWKKTPHIPQKGFHQDTVGPPVISTAAASQAARGAFVRGSWPLAAPPYPPSIVAIERSSYDTAQYLSAEPLPAYELSRMPSEGAP